MDCFAGFTPWLAMTIFLFRNNGQMTRNFAMTIFFIPQKYQKHKRRLLKNIKKINIGILQFQIILIIVLFCIPQLKINQFGFVQI